MSSSPESSVSSCQIPARLPGKSPEKRSFTQKCSMLSRYLKEKGSFGDLNIAMTSNETSPPSRPTTTMDLFPQHPCFSSSVAVENLSSNKFAKTVEKTGQMTMFYDGKVFVFDDVPAKKAEDIMIMARNDRTQIYRSCASNPTKTQKVSMCNIPKNQVESGNSIRPMQFTNTDFGNISIQENSVPSSTAPILWDLPITRRASLYRFLEKRKDRVAARAPYQTNGGPKKSTVENKLWLG